MESKAKYYKSGNYIITVLFVVLLAMLLYCAKVIEQDKVIYYLSMLCVGAWGCVSYNNIRKEKANKEKSKDSIIVATVTKDDAKKVVDNDVPDYILEEENYRVSMLNKALDSTLMVVDSEEKSIGTGIIIDENGTVMISACNVNGGDEQLYRTIGDEVCFRRYVSDKIIKGHVVQIIEDNEGNKFSLVELNVDNYTSCFAMGDSDNINIGTKVYGLAAFNVNNSINVIEGVVSQLNQLNRVDINGVEVFKSSNCLLYNGVSTDESIGGPLINSNGELVGVLLGRAKHYDRLNYALPINEIRDRLNIFVEEDNREEVVNYTEDMELLEESNEIFEVYKEIEDGETLGEEFNKSNEEESIGEVKILDPAIFEEHNESVEVDESGDQGEESNGEEVQMDNESLENSPEVNTEVFEPKDDEVGDETRDN